MIHFPLQSPLNDCVTPGELVFATTHNHVKICGDINRRARAPSSQYGDTRACCITCVSVQSLTQLCSPCPHVLNCHCSAQRQKTPSAVLRAEEIQILTFDMTFITGLSEWGENLISLLKRESAAPLYPRINAGLLATNSAGNKIPFFTCMPLLQAAGSSKKPWEKKTPFPHHFNKPGFIQQHCGRRRPAGCVIHRNAWKGTLGHPDGCCHADKMPKILKIQSVIS